MPKQDELVTMIDGHEMDIEPIDTEDVTNKPTAVCTYGLGPDVTLTVGKHVTVKMNIAETLNLIADLHKAVDEFTKRMEVFEQYYSKLHK